MTYIMVAIHITPAWSLMWSWN